MIVRLPWWCLVGNGETKEETRSTNRRETTFPFIGDAYAKSSGTMARANVSFPENLEPFPKNEAPFPENGGAFPKGKWLFPKVK
jgi:hypothetical protein